MADELNGVDTPFEVIESVEVGSEKESTLALTNSKALETVNFEEIQSIMSREVSWKHYLDAKFIRDVHIYSDVFNDWVSGNAPSWAKAPPTDLGKLSVNTAKGFYQMVTVNIAAAQSNIPSSYAYNSFYIVNGIPAIQARGVMLLIKQLKGSYLEVIRDYEKDAELGKVTEVRLTTASGRVYKGSYSMAEATAAGLAKKTLWVSYPRRMVYWKAIADLYYKCPEVHVGIKMADDQDPDLGYDDSGGVIR